MNEGLLNDAADSGVAMVQTFTSPVRLRQEREALGLHIAALAAALKVPVRKLEALEAGRYDELPDMTFARSLASSACRHLKIDPSLVLAQMPASHLPQLGEAQQMINAPFKGEHAAAPFDLKGVLRRPAVLIAGVVLLAALGLALMPAWKDMPGQNLVASVSNWFDSAEPESVTDTVPLITTEALPPDQDVAVEAASVNAATLTSELALPVPAQPIDAPATAEPTSDSGTLVLEALGDSWVEVVDGAGKVQIQRMMKKGDLMNFSSAPPYAVVLGRADSMKVTVRGRAFDTSAFARNSVARFEVK